MVARSTGLGAEPAICHGLPSPPPQFGTSPHITLPSSIGGGMSLCLFLKGFIPHPRFQASSPPPCPPSRDGAGRSISPPAKKRPGLNSGYQNHKGNGFCGCLGAGTKPFGVQPLPHLMQKGHRGQTGSTAACAGPPHQHLKLSLRCSAGTATSACFFLFIA